MFQKLNINKWIYLDSAGSTNDVLCNHYSKRFKNTNILLYSFKQTDGKGQMGRKWFSGIKKNLCISFFLPIKHLKATDQVYLNCFFSCQLHQWLNSMVVKGLKIKWPNDIYAGDMKLSGTLLQNSIQGANISNTIFGVGININQTEFPSDLPNPISLSQITQRSHDLNVLVGSFCHFLQSKLETFKPNNFKYFKQKYEAELYRLDQKTSFKTSQGRIFEGTIKGIDMYGSIIIEEPSGLHKYKNGEIQYLI